MRLIPILRRLSLGPLVVVLLSSHPLQATTDQFAAGDTFVSLSDGTVQWRSADGTLKQVLQTGAGPAKNMAFDPDGNLYVPHWYTTNATAGNNVAKLDTSGHLVGSFGSGYDCDPTSIQFDVAGNAYVGQADCGGDILKLAPNGNLIAKFDVPTELRGSGWIALGPDQCTIYYTSAGKTVFRFNACTNTLLAPLNSTPLPGTGARGIALLPGGGVLVADADEILRLDSSGNIVAHYDAVGENCWYSLNLDPSGTSFWAGDYCSSDVYKFDLTLGSITAHFVADTTALVKGVIVDPRSSGQSEPQPSTSCCRMAGQGSVLTPQGLRVTHQFQLRLPASSHDEALDVNWTPSAGDEQHFHLTSLIDAACVDSPDVDPGQSGLGDTFMARGVGTLNGQPGYKVDLVFVDAGDPGTGDLAYLVIRNPAGEIVLSVSGNLREGNHHAYACKGDCEHHTDDGGGDDNGNGGHDHHGNGGGDHRGNGGKDDNDGNGGKDDKHGNGGKDDKHGNGGKDDKHGNGGKDDKHGNGGKDDNCDDGGKDDRHGNGGKDDNHGNGGGKK